jgi:hypothetical protein
MFLPPGVSSVETNVEAKSVVVEASDAVPPQLMLEKLEKVSLSCGFHAVLPPSFSWRIFSYLSSF